MSADTTDPQSDSGTDLPPGYRRVENYNLVEQVEHVETGLVVECYRYARHHTTEDALADHYEFRLVVRPGGPGTPGACVDRTTERDPDAMLREWLADHPDGTADVEVDA